MGAASVFLSLFVALSLAVSWVAGDKEKSRLEKTIKDNKMQEQKLDNEIKASLAQNTQLSDILRETEGKLKNELAEKKKLERALSVEERLRRVLESNVETLKAARGGDVGVDIEKEREKMRAEMEAKAKEEIQALEGKLKAVEEARRQFEADMKKRLEEQARTAAWAQDEIKKRLREAGDRNRELEAKLEEVGRAKAAVESIMKQHERAKLEAERRLAEEASAKTELQTRLRLAEETLVAKASKQELARAGVAPSEILGGIGGPGGPGTGKVVYLEVGPAPAPAASQQWIGAGEAAIPAGTEAPVVTTMAERASAATAAQASPLAPAGSGPYQAAPASAEALQAQAPATPASTPAPAGSGQYQPAPAVTEAVQAQAPAGATSVASLPAQPSQPAAAAAVLGAAPVWRETVTLADRVSATAAALMLAELERGREEAKKRLEESRLKVAELEGQVERITKERDSIQKNLEEQGRRLAMLNEQAENFKREKEYYNRLVEEKKLQDQALKDAEAKRDEAQKRLAELESATVAAKESFLRSDVSAKLDAAALSSRIEELTKSGNELKERLVEAEIAYAKADASLSTAKKVFERNDEFASLLNQAQIALSRAERVSALAKELSYNKAQLENKLIEAQNAAENTDAVSNRVRHLLAQNDALQSKIKELETLSGSALELKAKNSDLEDRLRLTQAALAESQAAGQMAKGLIAQNAELESKLKTAGLLSLQGKAASFVAQKLIDRNTELEIKLKEAEFSLAQAEAMRAEARAALEKGGELAPRLKEAEFILAKNQVSTVALEKLNKSNTELAERIRQGELALAQAEAARFIAQELSAKNKELEDILKKEENSKVLSELVASKKALEEKLVAEAAIRVSLEDRLKDADTAKAVTDTMVKDLILAKMALEEELKKETERRKVVEAQLISGETGGGVRSDLVKGLEKELKETRATLEKERESKKELQAEIARVSRQAEELKKTGAGPIEIAAMQSQFSGLKEKLADKLRTGELKAEDIESMMDLGEALGFYVIKKGDTLWSIAGKKEIYGEPHMWPLLYRYNITKLLGPDLIEPDQVLIIYRNVSQAEAKDAVKKAKTRGDWKRWSDTDKLHWLQEWIWVDRAKEKEQLKNKGRVTGSLESPGAPVAAALNTERAGIEEQLKKEIEQRKVLEAKLRESESARTDALAGLARELDETKATLEREREGKRELKSEVERINRQMEALKASGGAAPKQVQALKGEVLGLKERLNEKLKTGELKAEEVEALGDGVKFYVVKKGDTLWTIAGKKEVYGDSFMWPLLYRYNLSKLKMPDIIEPEQVIMVYRDVGEEEARDAIKKAWDRGDWRKWSEADKQEWVQGWGGGKKARK